MSRRNSGVYYYSDIATSGETAPSKEDNKFSAIAEEEPKSNIREIDFQVMNDTITGKMVNGSLTSSTQSPQTATITTSSSLAPPGSPSRSRSVSSPPATSPDMNSPLSSNLITINEHTAPPAFNPYAEQEENGDVSPPSYASLTKTPSKKADDVVSDSLQSGAPLDISQDIPQDILQDRPKESPRRYTVEDSGKSQKERDYPMELTYIEESSKKSRKEKKIESEIEIEPVASSSREPHRKTVRYMLSRMNSLPSKDVLKITKEMATLAAPASPKQTAAKPPKVLKRNPSFWEVNDKKTKNQATLRRYADGGIATVTLNVSGTIFSTSTNTLLREPETLFATILDREEVAIRAGKQIFLDRNPKYFTPILDYMRTGSFDRDAHIKYAKSIMVEAEFFKVKGLIKMLHEVPELSRFQVIQIINSSDKPKLRGLWLPTINLAGVDLTRAVLDFSQLGKANLRNVLFGGASISNACLIDANLRNAIFNQATIAHTDFVRANISNSTLRFVKCQRCDFTDADLSYCAFEGSDFHGCDFTGANLSGADFSGADLTNSVFRNAIFSEETIFGNTITKNVDYEGSNIEVTKKKGGVFAMLGKKKKEKG